MEGVNRHCIRAVSVSSNDCRLRTTAKVSTRFAARSNSTIGSQERGVDTRLKLCGTIRLPQRRRPVWYQLSLASHERRVVLLSRKGAAMAETGRSSGKVKNPNADPRQKHSPHSPHSPRQNPGGGEPGNEGDAYGRPNAPPRVRRGHGLVLNVQGPRRGDCLPLANVTLASFCNCCRLQ